MSESPVLFAAVIIVISFLLNLIMLLIMRNRNRNDRTLKNISMQIKAFRNESTSTIERITTTGKECQQAVSAKVSEAEMVMHQVADSLDSLSQHHKDLAALESVCVNYKNALDKLRISTEQAEARIQAVQEEVRKAESVGSFAENFQNEAARLAKQLEEMKAGYTRLVASTQEGLRAASESQRNENQDMLHEFAVSLERFKGQFSDFVLQERTAFADMAEDERKQSENNALDSERRRDEVMKSIADSEERLKSFLSSIESSLSMLEEKNASLKNENDEFLSSFNASLDSGMSALSSRTGECKDELDSAFAVVRREFDDLKTQGKADAAALREEMESDSGRVIESTRNALDNLSSDFSSSASALTLSVSDTITAGKDEFSSFVNASLDRIKEEKETLLLALENIRRDAEEAGHNAVDTIAEALSNAEASRIELDAGKLKFISDASLGMKDSFNSIVEDIKAAFDSIREEGDSFISVLATRVTETRETIAELSEGEMSRIRDAVERLQELESRIKSAEEQLTAVTENVTRTREELFTAQQERGKLDAEIDQRTKELERLQSEMQESKSQRINEEAALVSLRLQIANLKEDAGTPAPAGQTGKKNGKKKQKRPEDMIGSVDDVYTGNEEIVDLSEDDE